MHLHSTVFPTPDKSTPKERETPFLECQLIAPRFVQLLSLAC